jgi:adenosylcobinamide-phosphate synthase
MTAVTVLIACALDVAIGDPRSLPHPVRLMGRAITWYEARVHIMAPHRTGQVAAGILLAVVLPVLSYGIGWLLVDLAGKIYTTVGTAMEVLLAFTTLAARDLADHAADVRRALKIGCLEDARIAVARIVGRDTGALSEEEVVRATVETVAESASDGIVAPLFYLVLGGAPLALAYKAISTMDSMVGHLDPRYYYLGWASARLDDIANWIPARMTALLIAVSAGVVFQNAGVMTRTWRIVWRDGKKHASPNSGRPEAAMAGALGIRLGGTTYYDGKPIKRPMLGDSLRPLSPNCIGEALCVMWMVFSVAGLIGLLVLL